MDIENYLTTGRVAQRLSALGDQIRNLCKYGEIPFKVANGIRLIHADDLEKVREACIKRGYIKAQPETAAA
ncbi:unnamed protein product [Gemmata massiliana]|uniref:Helix-turn-helix domain-containing protein n=1 Tax=Gemmata massiliana TaxID=1210884 RepID=A0A6P2D7R4_9BACT|nr:hypothetical protein [Gemmata massiliana]VTR97023.1 unnamed protein product [Gemmata massiliana]